MTVRRATAKKRTKYGKRWLISSRRNRPIITSTPPAAPWTIEAIAAFDATALARKLPPLIALNLRRLDRGKLRGVFDLYVTHWHQTIRSCLWFADQRHEWINLPKRQWTDKSGVTHYEEIVVFDDVHAARFQDCALEALRQLFARAEIDAMSASEDDQAPQQPLMNGAAVHIGGDTDDVPF